LEIKSLKGSLFSEKLVRLVAQYASRNDVVGIVTVTDVYPKFRGAADAKTALRRHVGNSAGEKAFRAHAAQYELEAWLLPFWDEIARSLGRTAERAKRPAGKPEEVNSQRPPSKHLEELFNRAGRKYDKVRYASQWLTAGRLEAAATHCPELKDFLNSILELAGAELLP